MSVKLTTSGIFSAFIASKLMLFTFEFVKSNLKRQLHTSV